MTTAILCEKQSQARAIGEALQFDRGQGTYQGTHYTIVSASGHLLEYEEPNDAKPDANWYDPTSLLPLPQRPRMRVSKRGKELLPNIRKVIQACDDVLMATDPDREGEAIGRNILAVCKYQGPVSRLMLLAGTDAPNVIAAFKKIQPITATEGLMRAQQARSVADWLWQFPTRGYTSLARAGGMGQHLGQGKGRQSVASVGRVQTPTLRLVVERDATIANFKPINHYKVHIEVTQYGETIDLSYHPPINEDVVSNATKHVEWRQAQGSKQPKPLFTGDAETASFVAHLKTIQDCSIQVQTRQSLKRAPLCLAMIGLQRRAAKTLKISSKETLARAQKLYADGYISYPRTEHEHLPLTLYEQAPDILRMLAENGFAPAGNARQRHADCGNRPRLYSDKKMEHHGLMPTGKPPVDLDPKHAPIYQIIAQTYIQAHYPDATTEQMVVALHADTQGLLHERPARFVAKREHITDPGWMAAFNDQPNCGAPLPQLQSGSAAITNADRTHGRTTPPAYFTEDTLLQAMADAARYVEGVDGTALKEAHGLGTGGTRGTIIDTLFVREYIARDKKNIRATSKGIDLIAHSDQGVSDIALSAQWETELSTMAAADPREAKQQRDAFIARQGEYITHMIQAMTLPEGAAANTRQSGTPTDKMQQFAQRIAESLDLTLPEDVSADFNACKAFIDTNRQAFEDAGGGGDGKPTKKMLAWAKKLAESHDVDLPKGAQKSFQHTKAFIESYKSRPTPKMLSYAKRLAERNDLELPQELYQERAICKQFLDQYAG